MNKSTLLILCAFLCSFTKLQAQDTPNPAANLQTLPEGSYIIPMDNTLQANTSGKFNLKAYGLVVHLLNNGIKLKWAIRAGKVKDGIDFSASAEKLKPVYTGGSMLYAFKAAPFVIFAADTTGVSNLVNGYYTSYGLIGNDRPNLYRTTSPTPAVDIRYNMSGFIPKAAILTDGGNQRIHRDYMIAAGINTANYQEVAAVTLSDCYTFASEPHNDESGPALDAIVASIRNFVQHGRNFLAECAAVRTYENNVFGKFHSSTGLADANEKIGTAVAYPHADLSYYQFDGALDASVGGSLQNWTIPGTLSNPASYSHATGTGIYSAVQAASVSKLGTGLGGLVFYLGNHEFKDNTADEINGIRMYLNAFLTPANPAAYCGMVLDVQLSNFQGSLQNNKVTLQWKVEQNEKADRFEVEKSTDGINFQTAGIVFGTDRAGTAQYPFTGIATEARAFYRIKVIEKTGAILYSNILLLQVTATANAPVKLLGNPVTDKLSFQLTSTTDQDLVIRFTDISGRQVWQQQLRSTKGSSIHSLSLPATIQPGIYIADFIQGNTHTALKFVRN